MRPLYDAMSPGTLCTLARLLGRPRRALRGKAEDDSEGARRRAAVDASNPNMETVP